MDVLPYWRMVSRAALAKTLHFTRNRILLGLCVSVTSIFLQYSLDLLDLGRAATIVVSLAGGALVSVVGSFIWLLVSIPAELHIVPKEKSPKEEECFRIAKDSLQRLGPSAVALLRYTIQRGLVAPSTLPPPESNDKKNFKLLEDLEIDGLIVRETSVTAPGSRLYDVSETRVTWKINSEMKTAIEELLYSKTGNL